MHSWLQFCTPLIDKLELATPALTATGGLLYVKARKACNLQHLQIMGQKDFISGSVLELKLPLGLGYAYCKILDFRHIREADGVLAKVFDYIVKEPLQDINVLRDKDWLFGARRMPALPNTRGKGAWKMKGVLIAEDDNVVPDFKYSPKSLLSIDDESAIQTWYVNRNIRELNDTPCSYEHVKHLEDKVLTSQDGIEIRTAMEYCRINNLDISRHFDLDDEGYRNIYRQMINVPIYSTIPKEIRGKALC